MSTATVSRALHDHPVRRRDHPSEGPSRQPPACATWPTRTPRGSHPAPRAPWRCSPRCSPVGTPARWSPAWRTCCAEAGLRPPDRHRRPEARERMLTGETRFRQRVDGVIARRRDVPRGRARAARAARRPGGRARRGTARGRLRVGRQHRRRVDGGAASVAARPPAHRRRRRPLVRGGRARRARTTASRASGPRSGRPASPLRPEYVVDGGFTIEGGRRAMLHARCDCGTGPRRSSR